MRFITVPRSRHRDLGLLDRYVVALLHGRTRGDRPVPTEHVGVVLEVDGLPLESRHPRPNSDVRDRIWAGDILHLCEPSMEHAVKASRLAEVAFLRVRRLAPVIANEVVHLAEHWPDAAHLPHQPLDGAPVR